MDSQYKHGGDVFGASRHLNRLPEDIYDFSANINPLGPSPRAIAAIRENLDLIRHYPDPHSADLRRAIAQHLHVMPDNIVLGNGAAELIYLLAQVLGCRRALVHAPTFIEYSEAVEGAGGTIIEVPLAVEENFSLSVPRIKKAMPEVDIIFLCNPNNPTGRVEKRSIIEPIIKDAWEKNITMVVDEAFMDFIGHREQCTVLPLISQYPNLVVLYSMTKFFGIPGLRLGALLGNKKWIDKISAIKDPWNVNTLAQIAGVASLADKDYAGATKKLVDTERQFLYQSMSNFPQLQVFPGDANYLLVRIDQPGLTSSSLAAKTAQKGVLIRDCSTFSGLGNKYIRVAIKTRAENLVLLQVLKEAMS